MTAVCCNRNVEQGELDRILGLLDGFGRAEQIPERLMDAAVSVGSSSPAYVFMFIEAMADAAVADGMPRLLPAGSRPRRCWGARRWCWRRESIRVS